MLIVNNVSKNYGKFCALKNINLEFKKGVYGFLAPNGAGKTTLIKMLTTLLYPTKGEIYYKGTDIFKMGASYRDILGYLPQEFGYYKNNSPRQFLFYLSALKGIEHKTAKDRINNLIELVGLEMVADKKMKKFSGGMIQRVGIAQAMLNDTEILILDEPTAGLDPKERVKFRNLLTELSREKIVILSTHIVADVESIANEIIMIKNKKILAQKTVKDTCQLLAGRVYETKIDFEETVSFRQKYFSLSEKQEGDKMKMRFIGEEVIDNTWEPVHPSVEDVFLHVYNDDLIEKE